MSANPTGEPSRRRFLFGSATIGLLTACGTNITTDESGTAAGGGFPLTVHHAFGSTVIPVPPQRVVTVGYSVSFSSVLSLPLVLERLVPRIAAALDGDPATR